MLHYVGITVCLHENSIPRAKQSSFKHGGICFLPDLIWIAHSLAPTVSKICLDRYMFHFQYVKGCQISLVFT